VLFLIIQSTHKFPGENHSGPGDGQSIAKKEVRSMWNQSPKQEGKQSTSFRRHAPNDMDFVNMSATYTAALVATRHSSANHRWAETSNILQTVIL